MGSNHSLLIRFSCVILGSLCLAGGVKGQSNSSPDAALVTDWTHRHLIYSSPSLEALPRLQTEPRYWQQWLRRNPAPSQYFMRPPSGGIPPFPIPPFPGPYFPIPAPAARFKSDWAVSLGPGATVGAGHYPAKYSFSITTANCGNAASPDFVAFNTSVAGSATQATIVAFDNLYSGCGGIVPTTYWAYNTGGTVETSSVLSLDGSQLAFVQSVSNQAQLVLLRWQKSTTATSTSPGAITVVSPSLYSTCAAPCMTTIAFRGGANDTNSSPFEDYSDDAIYVGDDSGVLHKFSPVFGPGTPSEITTGWPVTVASGLKLNSPVYDHGSGKVFVGSGYNGTSGSQLFALNGASGAVMGTSSSLGKGAGVAAGAVVDSSAGEVYAFVGNDGSTNCSGVCEGVYQFPVTFTSGKGTEATVGIGGSFTLYNGDFDNAYFNSGNGTGNLLVCGGSSFGVAEPSIYRVPVTAGVMSSSSIGGPALATSNVACSPVTDIYNPKSSAVGDLVFAGVPSGSDAKACSGGGCLVNLISNTWHASTTYTVGQIVLDSSNYMQVAVTTTGTSKSGSAPLWVDMCGTEVTDGTVTWTNAGFLTPVTPAAWQAGAFWSVGYRILDSNQNIECALSTGVASGATAPTWKTAIGAVTTETTGLQWRNGGPMTTHALSTAGGTSGIILDNIVGSGVLAGASQVYFSTLGTGGCGTGNGCAVQASQSGLN